MQQLATKLKNHKKAVIITSVIIVLLAAIVTTFCILYEYHLLPRWGSCGNNVSWYYNGKGTLTISGIGKMDDYIGGYIRPGTDRSIPHAPWIKLPITTVIVEEGITHIGNGAFTGGKDEIILPNSLNSIGKDAFARCNIETIKIPDGVTCIEDYTFESCWNLSKISLPDSITTIGGRAFADCKSLTNINIPTGVTEIGGGAFSDCTSLTNINIPTGVTEINAFQGCTALKSINIPYGVTEIGGFSGCTSLKSIKIPDSVNKITQDAFHSCTSLENIRIPSSVKVIEFWAFYNCTNLKEIRFYGLPPTNFEDSDTLAHTIFSDNVYATAYCPRWTWSGINLELFGGNIEWVPWTPV